MHGFMVLFLASFAVAVPSGKIFLPAAEPSIPTHTLAIPSGGYNYQNEAPQPSNLVTNNLFIYSGVDDNDADDDLGNQEVNSNYNILFVKAPVQSAESLAKSLARSQEQDKTVVYILNKKTDASDLQDELNKGRLAPVKPEVFFIKYKTPEEAVHAQQAIKSQYDSLGGETNVSDEGSSPVTSVIGSAGTQPAQSFFSTSSNQYLPPTF